MKVRLGFVSNSSSSSFIVIPDYYDMSNKDVFINIFENYLDEYTNDFNYSPQTEFGWEFIKYTSIEEKFDWCCLMLNYFCDNPSQYKEYYNNFYCFMKEMFPEMNNFNYYNNDCIGFIDHQSMENEDNWKIFDSVDSLKAFIFGNGCIYGGNDNSNFYWDDNGILQK